MERRGGRRCTRMVFFRYNTPRNRAAIHRERVARSLTRWWGFARLRSQALVSVRSAWLSLPYRFQRGRGLSGRHARARTSSVLRSCARGSVDPRLTQRHRTTPLQQRQQHPRTYETAGRPYYTGYGTRSIDRAGLDHFVRERGRHRWRGLAASVAVGRAVPPPGHDGIRTRRRSLGPLGADGVSRTLATSSTTSRSSVSSCAHLRTCRRTSRPRERTRVASPPRRLPARMVSAHGRVLSWTERAFRDAQIVAPNVTRLRRICAAAIRVRLPGHHSAASTRSEPTYHVRSISPSRTLAHERVDFSTGSTISGGAPARSPVRITASTPRGCRRRRFRDASCRHDDRDAALPQPPAPGRGRRVSPHQSRSGLTATLVPSPRSDERRWPSANRIAVQNEVRRPGGSRLVHLHVKAPFSAGTVRIPVRPVVDGVAWLEARRLRAGHDGRRLSQPRFPVRYPRCVLGDHDRSRLLRNAGSLSWSADPRAGSSVAVTRTTRSGRLWA